MDKKRVLNAAVTAGLSLSMVLTSVPAVALAQAGEDASAVMQTSDSELVVEKSVNVYFPDGSYKTYAMEVVDQGNSYKVVSLPSVDEVEGYEFAGWTLDGDAIDAGMLTVLILPSSSVVAGNYVESQTSDPEVGVLNVHVWDTLSNSEYTVMNNSRDWWYVSDPSSIGLSHEGYAFAGWTLDYAGSQALTDPTFEGQSGDVTVYAQWTKVEADEPETAGKVTIIYRDSLNADWEGSTSFDIDNDTWYYDPTGYVSFAHPGYKFVGWSSDQQGADMLSEDWRPLSADPITVWAQWEPIEVGDVTVTYKDSLDPDAIGSISEGIPSDLWYVDPVEMNMFAHPGYEFVGWSYNQDGTDPLKQGDTPSGDIVIWAQWKKVESPEVGDVTVTYKDSLDPEAIGSKSYDIPADSWYVDPTENGMFAHYGYEFVGWSYSQDGSDMIDPSAQPTGDMVVWAQWEQVELGDVTVTYKDSLDPEAEGSKAYDIPSDSWYVNPTETGMFSHEGYKFVGWSYNQDGSDPIDPYAQPTGDMVVWAQWEQVETTDVTVTYKDALDPENPGSKSYDVPSNLWYVDPVEAGMFAHEGYEFVGWSYNQDGSDPLAPTDMPSGDMVIWAQWRKVSDPVETHTVTFVDKYNGTQSTVTVENGDVVFAPTSPSYPGYTFVGWSTDGFEYAEYDFASPVTGDLVLYASYVKNAEPSVPEQDQPAAPAPSDEVSPEQAKADAAAEAEANVPETGDVTNATAVAGIGIAGLVAAAASFFLRRRNEQ